MRHAARKALLALAALWLAYRLIAAYLRFRRRRARLAAIRPIPEIPGDSGDALRDDYLHALVALCRRCPADVATVLVDGEPHVLVANEALASQMLSRVPQCSQSPVIVAPCVAMLRGRRPLLALNDAEWTAARSHFDTFAERVFSEHMVAAIEAEIRRISPGPLDVNTFAQRVTVHGLVAGLGRKLLTGEEVDTIVACINWFLDELPIRAYSEDSSLREDYLSPSPDNLEMAKQADTLIAALKSADCDHGLLAEALLSSFLPTATCIALSLYFVAANPLAQSTLVSDSSFALAVLWESLRLCPPFPLLSRQTPGGFDLGLFRVPPQTRLWVPLWWLGKSTKIWGLDADDFRPHRWLGGSSNLPPGGCMAFGQGRRACPGVALATMLQTKVLYSTVREYELKARGRGGAKLPIAFTGVGVRPFDPELVKVSLTIDVTKRGDEGAQSL